MAAKCLFQLSKHFLRQETYNSSQTNWWRSRFARDCSGSHREVFRKHSLPCIAWHPRMAPSQTRNKWRYQLIGVPKNGWFIMENQILLKSMMNRGTPIYGNPQIITGTRIGHSVQLKCFGHGGVWTSGVCLKKVNKKSRRSENLEQCDAGDRAGI